jgi:hypothetical protein
MADKQNLFQQDLGRSKPKLDILACMHLARARHGKSYAAQIADILSLQMGDGRISPLDYYYYRLYDDSLYPPEEKRRFLSDGISFPITEKCCDPHWWAAADDKLLAYTILGAYGAPTPETQAAFSLSGRNGGRVKLLDSVPGLARFLARDARYPLFAKPIGGIGSFGACRIEAESSGELRFADGSVQSVAEFAARLDVEDGYLLQTVIKPHPDLQEIADTACTLRLIVIFEGGKPQILHTIWKLTAAGNVADNFWRPGNILADVDADTGIVRRAMRGFGPAIEELENHPDSGRPIRGVALPHFAAARALCLECAPIFIGLRYQSWDIALCAQGPVIVEVNTGSAFNLPQLATGRGLLTDRFRAFLASCGYRLRNKA